MAEKLLNYVNGAWRESAAEHYLEVRVPATDEILATVPLTPPGEVEVEFFTQTKVVVERWLGEWSRTC